MKSLRSGSEFQRSGLNVRQTNAEYNAGFPDTEADTASRVQGLRVSSEDSAAA